MCIVPSGEHRHAAFAVQRAVNSPSFLSVPGGLLLFLHSVLKAVGGLGVVAFDVKEFDLKALLWCMMFSLRFSNVNWNVYCHTG